MGGGCGEVLATTWLVTTAAGGQDTPPGGPAARPSTLSRCGTTGAVFITCPCWPWRTLTLTETCCTGRAPPNAPRGTPVIAPGALWLTYRMFVTLMLLIT